ncbi:hypothetical protein M5X11_12360 [Paenibacillus alginolyticus]|uniref:hypothetical protein n=1 Tax=Paenibacillus alginolyticus TaxID=59839 RepID=UPI0004927D32|nr:hypothetical protein [Paenibacillus alginolyticus]MCY9665748.1 hypothetical protein [Paenibacillus alginolyticus]
MYQGYKPNVPVPDTNSHLFSQIRLNMIEVGTNYLGRNRQGQLSFFAKDGEIRTFFRPECIEMVNDYEDSPGGLSRAGLVDMLNHLDAALKKRPTILYADIIIDYEADEDGSLAYLKLNIRNQEHFAAALTI